MENNDQREQTSTPSWEPSAASPPARIQHASNVKSAEADEISLKELILKLREWYRYLMSRWRIIMIAGVLGGILGLTYAWFQKPLYIATTTFVLEGGEGGGGGLGQYSGIASMVGIDVGGGGGGIFQGDNIIELYKSRTMIEKTLLSTVVIDGKNQLLINRYIDFNNLRRLWGNKPELDKINFDSEDGKIFTRIQDSILGTMVNEIKKEYLSISKPDKKLSIIRVDVKSRDESFSKTFNDQIVRNVNDFYIQTKTKKSLENIGILQLKADSVRSVMNGAIYSAATVADATPNLNVTRQIQRAAPIQRSQFTAEMNKTILGELVKNLEMSKIALRKETPLIQVVDQPVFPLEKVKFSKSRGIILGGFLFGFITLIILLFNKILKSIMA